MRFPLLKFIGAPGSAGFLAAGAIIALLLMLSKRRRRLGIRVLVTLGVLYLVLSVPAIAHSISAGVTGQLASPHPRPTLASDLFVFEGDNYRARAALAAEIYGAGPPRTVWVLGSDGLRDALLVRGIPSDRWRFGGPGDRSTHGQVVQMQRLMAAHGIGHGVVIVSRLQAPRVVGMVQRMGLTVDVVASPVDHEPATIGAARWTPSLSALALSRDAIYEWAALAYYHWKGWV